MKTKKLPILVIRCKECGHKVKRAKDRKSFNCLYCKKKSQIKRSWVSKQKLDPYLTN